MNGTWNIRWARAGWFAPALAFAIGCGGGVSPPSPSDPTVARQALQTALDAWKEGGTPDSLRAASPPIQVADQDWLAGLRLDGYTIADVDQKAGSSLSCPVELSLKDAKGKALKKRARYLVATNPSTSVVRQDED